MNSYQVKKKKKPLPPWVSEHGALIFLALILGLYLVPKLLGCFGPAEVPSFAPRPSLTILMGPIKTWQEGRATYIKSVQLKVKNRGAAPAVEVSVVGIFRGIPVPFQGKSTLMVGEVGDYVVYPPMSVLSSDSMDFKLSCLGCEVAQLANATPPTTIQPETSPQAAPPPPSASPTK